MADFKKVKRVMFGAPHIEDTLENKFRCNPYYIFSTKWTVNPLLNGVKDAVIMDGNKMTINQFIPNIPIAYSQSTYTKDEVLKITRNLKAYVQTSTLLHILEPYQSKTDLKLQGIVFNAVCVNDNTNGFFYTKSDLFVEGINVGDLISYDNQEYVPCSLLDNFILTDRSEKGVWGICYLPPGQKRPLNVCPDWNDDMIYYAYSGTISGNPRFALSISFYTSELSSDNVVDISSEPMIIEMPPVYADDPTLNECYKIYKGSMVSPVYSKERSIEDYQKAGIITTKYIDGYNYWVINCSTTDDFGNLLPYKLLPFNNDKNSTMTVLFHLLIDSTKNPMHRKMVLSLCLFYQDPLQVSQTDSPLWHAINEAYFQSHSVLNEKGHQIISGLLAETNMQGTVGITYTPSNGALPVNHMLALSNITSVYFHSSKIMTQCQDMFALAYKLKKITWQDGSKVIQTNNATGLFQYCSSLQAVTDEYIKFTGNSQVVLNSMFHYCHLPEYTIYTYDTSLNDDKEYEITPSSMIQFLANSKMKTLHGVINCQYLSTVKMIDAFNNSIIEDIKLKNLPVGTWNFTDDSIIGPLRHLSKDSIRYLVNNLLNATTANPGKLSVPATLAWREVYQELKSTLLLKKWNVELVVTPNLKG